MSDADRASAWSTPLGIPATGRSASSNARCEPCADHAERAPRHQPKGQQRRPRAPSTRLGHTPPGNHHDLTREEPHPRAQDRAAARRALPRPQAHRIARRPHPATPTHRRDGGGGERGTTRSVRPTHARGRVASTVDALLFRPPERGPASRLTGHRPTTDPSRPHMAGTAPLEVFAMSMLEIKPAPAPAPRGISRGRGRLLGAPPARAPADAPRTEQPARAGFGGGDGRWRHRRACPPSASVLAWPVPTGDVRPRLPRRRRVGLGEPVDAAGRPGHVILASPSSIWS